MAAFHSNYGSLVGYPFVGEKKCDFEPNKPAVMAIFENWPCCSLSALFLTIQIHVISFFSVLDVNFPLCPVISMIVVFLVALISFLAIFRVLTVYICSFFPDGWNLKRFSKRFVFYHNRSL